MGSVIVNIDALTNKEEVKKEEVEKEEEEETRNKCLNCILSCICSPACCPLTMAGVACSGLLLVILLLAFNYEFP